MVTEGFSDALVLQKSYLVGGNSKWQHFADKSTNKSCLSIEYIYYATILQVSRNAVLFPKLTTQKMLFCGFTAESHTVLNIYNTDFYSVGYFALKRQNNFSFHLTALWFFLLMIFR